MATVAELTKMRADLFAARMTGAREFEDQNGERIQYKSDAEMARALAALDSEIAALTTRPANTILFRTSKGL